MCELFGMSASRATDVNRSLALLRPRGGATAPHSDGWGIAFYDGRAARIFKEPVPAADSRCLAFISEYEFTSATVIAHIRKANPSAFGRTAANTHPFERELGGRSWVFAHNGRLENLHSLAAGLRRFHPIGETDSELAFCLLLDAVADHVGGPDLDWRKAAAALRPRIRRLAASGEFNFLLSDGEYLFANASTRLHALRRTCREAGCDQEVTLLATEPLTAESWEPLERLHVYRRGRPLTSSDAPISEELVA